MIDKQNKIDTLAVNVNGVDYAPVDSLPRPDIRPDGLTYCIIRCRMAGVIAGYADFDASTRDGFVVYDGRQLWRWDSNFVLADLAQSGVRNAQKCKFSEPSGRQKPLDPYQIFECTEKAGESIRAVPNANR
jgi:hypothetical protein